MLQVTQHSNVSVITNTTTQSSTLQWKWHTVT